MIQCSDCEHFNRDAAGRTTFSCDPFSSIKEEACLAKLQLVRTIETGQKLDRLVNAYEATLQIYRRMQPMQEKLMEHMEREIQENEDGDSWKYGQDTEDDSDDPIGDQDSR